MKWLRLYFSGRGAQLHQREESLNRLGDLAMSKLDAAKSAQCEAREEFIDAAQEQKRQSTELRCVIDNVVGKLRRRDDLRTAKRGAH